MTNGIESRKPAKAQTSAPFLLERVRGALGIPDPSDTRFARSVPFSLDDATAGSENELQVAVCGPRTGVDLPLTIEGSEFFANIVKRAAAGDTSSRAVTDLERCIDANNENVWENSWARFPLRRLSPFARQVLDDDTLADKRRPHGPVRKDLAKFFVHAAGEDLLRIPISYLMKLALADVVGSRKGVPDLIARTARRLMDHFLSDNTSPETLSFHVVTLVSENGLGSAPAKEASKRFLLAQLLVMYANREFGLGESGQSVQVYFSPHPPIRQKELNDCVSDSFYRELFMSPCLSGWDDGQSKHEYMCLCHEVLSRSRLNAMAKLREAGIIPRNLVVLPNISNISLANNGTHISLGSRKLTAALESGSRCFGAVHEKYLGDLTIKIMEHFFPLFVGTYSAAPYRLDFSDFHPEVALGFLPHELDYTHLRMIWRRWKKKAGLKVFGQPLTPFGIRSLDRLLSSVFRMRGDFVPDFRLIDYLAGLSSTSRSPALDGTPGNAEKLKRDLAELGVFDARMALYALCRPREYARHGFSGFENRYYSLFESLTLDMAHAVNLQHLLTVLAYKYALEGKWTHAQIPDDPAVESERRQIFFGSAIGIPTFYVREDTPNILLRSLIGKTPEVRRSRRYPGYLRVHNGMFRRTLAHHIRDEAADLVEMFGLEKTMQDLYQRLEEPEIYSAEGKLVRGILAETGASSAMKMDAREFNTAAERYYRNTLNKRLRSEALDFLASDCRSLIDGCLRHGSDRRAAIDFVLAGLSACGFVSSVRGSIIAETADREDLVKVIDLLLITIEHDICHSGKYPREVQPDDGYSSSIHRSRHRIGEDGAVVLG